MGASTQTDRPCVRIFVLVGISVLINATAISSSARDTQREQSVQMQASPSSLLLLL